MITRLRKFEASELERASDKSNALLTIADNCAVNARPSRQLVVAVTANSAECEECGVNGFDEICAKPLSREDIYSIVTRHFQK